MRKCVFGIIIFALVFMNTVDSKGEDAMIADGKTVKFHYTLTVEGNVVDSSDGKDPITYTHGQKTIVTGLERQLTGLKAGDARKVTVASEEGYGPVNPQMIIEVPKDNIDSDQEPQTGMILQLASQEGQVLKGVITEIKEETLVLNFNHPLAGKELQFDIEIVEVQ